MKNVVRLVVDGEVRVVNFNTFEAPAEPNPPIQNNTSPSIVGPPYAGQEVTASVGTWWPTADSYSFQWYRNNVPISGANSINYTLVTADIGTASISVDVTASRSNYTATTVRSAAINVSQSTTLVDSEELTPAADTPTFSYSSLGASAVPTIAGSAGWLREKRTGVAETAAGGSQSSTAALDLSGSTRFRYSGFPLANAWTTNAANYVETDNKPGGGSQSAKWLFTLEFVVENTNRVELRLNAPVNNPRLGVVVVNGRRVQATPIMASATGGSGYSAVLTFPTSARRHIKIYGLNHNLGRFGGVAVPSGGVVSKPTNVITKRIAIIGDSFTNGANGVTSVETFAFDLVRKMGGDEIIQAGIGGTGFVTTINGESNSNYQGRVADILSMNPHAIVFVGGRNDGNTGGLSTAVGTILDSTNSVPIRWVVSQDLSAPGNTVIKNATEGRGVRFVDTSDHVSNIEISNDGVHPTFNGHRQYATLIYGRMLLQEEEPSDELTPFTGTPSDGLFFEHATASQISSGPTPDRKALGHYYGPQPGAFSNAASDYYESNYLPVNGEGGIHAVYGGYLRDRPKLGAPFPTTPVSWQRNMQAREIQAAKAAGLDGFFCNIMGSSGDNWNRYIWMLEEAAANFPGFKVVPMVDANGGMAQSQSTAIAAERINTFLSSSAAWRLSDGRYMVATFKMEGRPLSYWTEVKNLLQSTYGKNTAWIGVYNNINQAVNYSSIQWAAGQWGPGADPNIYNNYSNYGTAIKGRGEKYLIPTWSQDIRYRSGIFDEACNTESIRAALDAMIRQNADITQYCTWSDHSEASQLRPTVMRGHVPLDVAAYRLTKWKTGKFPVILRDAIYLSHRNQMLNATITGGQTMMLEQWVRGNRSNLREKVEVLTYFTAPAQVTLKVGSAVYNYTAPAGEYAYTANMQAGEVSVKAVRSSIEIARVNSPVVIRTTAVNQDRQYAMFSSLRGTTGQYDPTPGAPTPNASNYVA